MRRETFTAPSPSAEAFVHQMATRGWAHFPSEIEAADLPVMRTDLQRIYRLRRAVQERNGVAAGMEGTAHHMPGEGGSLDAFLNNLPLADMIERHFGGKYILLNFGAVMHPPGGKAYTLMPHRDIRAWSADCPLSLNMLVMLDDFTVENGATLLLSGSHQTPAMPTVEAFHSGAEPAVGRAGDILLFNSLLVHAAAPNRSNAERRALTLCFGRPFMKPQMDWPRYLPADAEKALSPLGRQLLGYHAQIPDSLDAYYQPAERWAFRPDQR